MTLNLAKQLYPNCVDEYDSWNGVSDYSPIINYFGNVLIEISDGGYGGDDRVLLEKDGRFGILIFGWGSCSYNDALQGCESVEELNDLIEHLETSIKWFESLEECKEYVRNKDWELEWHWNGNETKVFIEEVLNYNIR